MPLIYSDYGAHFVGASDQLDKEMQQALEVASKKVAAISGRYHLEICSGGYAS